MKLVSNVATDVYGEASRVLIMLNTFQRGSNNGEWLALGDSCAQHTRRHGGGTKALEAGPKPWSRIEMAG